MPTNEGPKEQHKSYEERMTEFYDEPLEQIDRIQQEETDWGSPVGDEVW